MGLLSRLGISVTKAPKRRESDINAAAAFLLGGWPGVPEWSEDNYETFAREGYGRNELVYACITQITSSASDAPLVLQRDTGNDTPERVTGTPLADLIEQPNPQMSAFEFMEALNLYLQIAGNAYVFKLRGGLRQVAGLYLLRPDRVQIIPGNGVAAGYLYQVDGKEYRIAGEDVGHIKLPNPLSDWYGLSPLHVLARQVNLDTGMTDFVKAFFSNAGVPAGLLNVKRKLQSAEEAEYVRTRWRAQFGGPQGWHRLAVLDEDATYQQTAVRPDEMAMPDLRNLTESRICAAFGVPLSVVGATLGMASSSYANRESDRRMFWEQTLLPLYRRISDALNRILLPEFPDAGDAELRFDFGNVAALQDDLNAKATRIASLFDSGIIMRDEARSELGFDPSPTGFGDVFKAAMSTVYQGPDAETADPPRPQATVADVPTVPGVPGVPGPDTEGDATAALPEPGKAYTYIELAKPTERQQRYLDMLARILDAHTDRAARDITRYFGSLRQRVDGIVGRHMAAAPPETKIDELPFSADDLLPHEAEAELQRIMRGIYLNMAEASWDAVNTAGLLGDVAYLPDSPVVQRILAEGSTRVVKIVDATRAALNQALSQGLERGYSMQQIANGVPDDAYPGLKSLVTELYKNRATTIARTETATAQNLSVAARYEASGVVEVTVMDGDQDAACAAVNGSRQSIEWARNYPIAHPNCTRAILPVVASFARSAPAPATALLPVPVVAGPSRVRKTIERDEQGRIVAIVEEVA